MARGQSISSDVLARYAADAAQEVDGVRAVSKRHVRVEDAGIHVDVHVEVDWGASIPALGGEIRRRVADYLRRMADVDEVEVEVVVEAVGPSS